MLTPLPIDSLIPAIVASLRARQCILISAPAGSGKTTRVPRALLDAGFSQSGEILVLEPRRLATRLAATRVAEELGESVGETVGYSIRFESVGGPRTRLRFLTEGVFSRRIVQNPTLPGVSAVILDEFHERHLTTDLALGFIRRLQHHRPDLKLAVMSATLEAREVAAFLDDAPLISGGVRPFDITVEYKEIQKHNLALEEGLAAAIARILAAGLAGDILVFLPGAGEIRRSMEALRPLAARANLDLIPLHGDLPASEQFRAVQPSGTRRIILATNVAETSITIPGVGIVVDSGLARISSCSPWSGLPRLTLSKISKASAEQRAGRAGRTQSGHVVRLYSQYDFASRPERDPPEVRRTDLAETILTLHGAGIRDVRAFEWFERPPEAAVEAAETLLSRLTALDSSGRLTDTGRRMLLFPVHPRMARLITEGERRGVAEHAVLLAALLSEREIRLDVRTEVRGTSRPKIASPTGTSDLIEMLDRFQEAQAAGLDPRRVSSLGLDRGALESVEKARRKMSSLLPRHSRAARPGAVDDESLRIATLAAFPDRVAKRPSTSDRTLVLASGGSARLSEHSVVHAAPLMVAVDVEERAGGRGSADTQSVVVRAASSIEPEWLLDLFPDEVREDTSLNWNEAAGRVDAIRRTTYGQVVLEENVRPAPVGDSVSELLAEKVLQRGPSLFADSDKTAELKVRLQLAARVFPKENFPTLEDDTVRQAIRRLCDGKRSFAELSGLSLAGALLNPLTPRQREVLSREIPERIALRAGRAVKVHYEATQSPWIESRLQDFFGMTEAPTICSGRIPLTVHLLAPNGRPVQVTQDLSGFWERHYPDIKRELKRRYPKHAWP